MTTSVSLPLYLTDRPGIPSQAQVGSLPECPGIHDVNEAEVMQ